MTRQLNDVILERNDTNLSKEQAYILPNLNESIKPGELIPNNTLYQALNGTPESEFWDVDEKHYKYTQRINWADYAKPDQLFSSEKEFIVASLLNNSEDALKLSTVKDIFAIKSTNSSFNTKAGNLQFLANIREKLKNLPYNSIELQKITMYINEQEKSLNAPVTRRTIKSNFAFSQHDKCKDCIECTNSSLEVRTTL